MTTNNRKETTIDSERASTTVDYRYLMMLDFWSCKDAALIICGFDPEQYRHVRFYSKYINANSNPELIEAYKLYKLFESANQSRAYSNRLGHPISYITVCLKKDWSIPDELFQLADQRYRREHSIETADSSEEKQVVSRAKDSILKAFAAMVMLYISEKKDTHKYGTFQDINVSQVTDKILEFLENNNFKIHGLGKSSLNEKIGQAIRLFKHSCE